MFTQKTILKTVAVAALALGILVPSFAISGFAADREGYTEHRDNRGESRDAYGANRGGYTGPGPELVTVKQALDMWDDDWVTLKGRIVKSLGDDMYTFHDGSGSITVEIDDDVWQGLSVGPETVVVISGEIDKDWMHTEVEVSSIRPAE